MTRSRCLTGLDLLCQSLWLAVVVAGGLSAATVFTPLPPLEPQIIGYEIDDVEMRGRLAAGLITQPLFELADIVQLILFPLAIVIIIAQRISGLLDRHSASQWIRIICIGLAGTFLVARFVFVNPPMHAHLDGYRDAARAGDLESARSKQTSFNEWHHTAERLWGLTGLCLIVSIAATGVSLAPRSKPSS